MERSSGGSECRARTYPGLRFALQRCRFEDDVKFASPTAVTPKDEVTPESSFEALMDQQRVPKQDLQLPEWEPS